MTVTTFLLVCGAAFVGGIIGWLLGVGRAKAEADRRQEDLATTVDIALDTVRHERGEMMQAALDTVLSVASSKLGDQLEAGRATVASEVVGVQSELQRVASLVAELQKERAHQAGQLNSGLEQAVQVTSALADTTRSLQQALASSNARGQWGERMAQDVLDAAGFIEGINYTKQTKLSNGGIPDYTFSLPQGHVVHMDVKFPIGGYLQWLDAEDDESRARHARYFQKEVRQRVKEMGERAYTDAATTVDYLLLFVPNESVYGFLHEHDPAIIDVAITQKVVLCSPTTLFAVLAVIRQSVDNFLIDQRSDDILGAVGALREQWERWADPMEKMRRGLSSAQKAFDELSGPRTRQFTHQLEKLEMVRDHRLGDPPAQLMLDPIQPTPPPQPPPPEQIPTQEALPGTNGACREWAAR